MVFFTLIGVVLIILLFFVVAFTLCGLGVGIWFVKTTTKFNKYKGIKAYILKFLTILGFTLLGFCIGILVLYITSLLV
jgi:hypothetical protein